MTKPWVFLASSAVAFLAGVAIASCFAAQIIDTGVPKLDAEMTFNRAAQEGQIIEVLNGGKCPVKVPATSYEAYISKLEKSPVTPDDAVEFASLKRFSTVLGDCFDGVKLPDLYDAKNSSRVENYSPELKRYLLLVMLQRLTQKDRLEPVRRVYCDKYFKMGFYFPKDPKKENAEIIYKIYELSELMDRNCGVSKDDALIYVKQMSDVEKIAYPDGVDYEVSKEAAYINARVSKQ